MARIGYLATTGKNVRLRLELTEPSESDGEWNLTVIALVADNDGPIADQEVQFYHNAKTIDSPVSTDGEGRAIKDLSGLSKGNHTFEAQLVGTTIKSRQTKLLKSDKPKKPGKLIVQQRRTGKVHTLVFQVLTADDAPVGNVVIQILDPTATESIRKLSPTGKDGVVTETITVEEQRRVLTVLVLGSSIQEDVYLSNPSSISSKGATP